MKCISCETDNSWLDRITNSGRCKNCQHSFVFDPQQKYADLFTDDVFDRAIDDISERQTLFFAPQQLFYRLDKELRNTNTKKIDSTLIVVIFITLLGLIIGIFPIAFPDYGRPQEAYTIPAILLILLAGAIAIFKFSSIATNSEPTSITQNQFQDWLERWNEVNSRTLEKLLPYPKSETGWQGNPDRFQQIIICDRPEIAQLLLANNFPLENNCAICDIDGYKLENWKKVKQAIERYPDLKIYVLHDAAPEGASLVSQLTNEPNLPIDRNTKIHDLGLWPRQLFKNENILVQNSYESGQEAKKLPESIKQKLLMKELNWLDAGNFVELESFSYAKLREIIVKGMESDRPVDL
ncbi:MAG: hypothetical protein KME17_26860 [Cyanosarcina radialis HA8281-LM2]|nr:hypothetical protein [Cyanosarcina radialis HA8281-LM2]